MHNVYWRGISIISGNHLGISGHLKGLWILSSKKHLPFSSFILISTFMLIKNTRSGIKVQTTNSKPELKFHYFENTEDRMFSILYLHAISSVFNCCFC